MQADKQTIIPIIHTSTWGEVTATVTYRPLHWLITAEGATSVSTELFTGGPEAEVMMAASLA